MKDLRLAVFNTDLGHNNGSLVDFDFRVMLRVKRTHKRNFAYEYVRRHSPMMYTDLIYYNIVGVTETPLLRGSAFISKLESLAQS